MENQLKGEDLSTIFGGKKTLKGGTTTVKTKNALKGNPWT